MTLITEAQALVDLAQQADSAADRSTTEAALDAVLEKLVLNQPPVAPGVLSSVWWEKLDVETQTGIRQAAERASKAVVPLVDGSDDVLASYGLNDGGAPRGALAEIGSAFGDFSRSAKEAQDRLLQSWRESLWPPSREAELEIHSIVADTEQRADWVLRVLRVLEESVESYRICSADELQNLHTELLEAKEKAESLLVLSVPVQVLDLFQVTIRGSETSLASLSPSALGWLADHGASELFMIRRASSVD